MQSLAHWVIHHGIGICDLVCKKGSYSLSKLSRLTNHVFNLSPHITPSHSAILGYKGTTFQGDTTLTSQVTGCQVHAIEKAIRPFLQTGSHIHIHQLVAA